MQNFRGLCQRWWSEQIASLTHESFCLFFVPSPGPQVASLDAPPLANTSLYVVSAKVEPFGGETD